MPLGDAADLAGVVAELDPPLNLSRAGSSPLRDRIRDARRAIRRGALNRG